MRPQTRSFVFIVRRFTSDCFRTSKFALRDDWWARCLKKEKMCSRALCFRKREKLEQQQSSAKYFSSLGEAKYFQSRSDSIFFSLSRAAESSSKIITKVSLLSRSFQALLRAQDSVFRLNKSLRLVPGQMMVTNPYISIKRRTKEPVAP